MKGDQEFIRLGMAHAQQGLPRYKFQDPHLQALYDRGYKLESGLTVAIKKRCASCGSIFQTNSEDPARYCGRC